MEKISLLEFFKFGKFGDIKLGQTKDELKKNFVNSKSKWSDEYGHEIWTYGDMELHFFKRKSLVSFATL